MKLHIYGNVMTEKKLYFDKATHDKFGLNY